MRPSPSYDPVVYPYNGGNGFSRLYSLSNHPAVGIEFTDIKFDQFSYLPLIARKIAKKDIFAVIVPFNAVIIFSKFA